MTYIPSTELVLDDKSATPRAPNGLSRGYRARDYEREPLGFYNPKPFALQLIPREEWFERATELEAKKQRLSDLIRRKQMKPLNQNGTNFCWYNGVVTACQILMLKSNQPFRELSSASGASKIKNFRNQGGWGDQAATWMASHGTVPADMWPVNAIDRKYDTDAAWTEADKYVLKEWHELQPRNIDQLFTCLLNRIPVPGGYNHWSHLVCNVDVVPLSKPTSMADSAILKAFGSRILNSWGSNWSDNGFGILTGTKQLADGQLSTNSMRLLTRKKNQ